MKVEFAEGFQNSMDRLFHWRYAPLRAWKFFLRIPRELKWKLQRMTRGWSDQDVWGAYSYIADVISGMLVHLSEHHGGHPIDMTDEEWTAKLKDLSVRIKAYNTSEDLDNWSGEKEEESYEITQQALKEMADVFGRLWD